MNIKHFQSQDFNTTRWSGGTTTELFIWPMDAQFKLGNFAFRLSTATVEIPESKFSALPDTNRTLMVLDGQITLTHEGHHSKRLGAFETDHFKGEWTTLCEGTCTDFNLMTKGTTKGSLVAIQVGNQETKTINIAKQLAFCFAFTVTGKITIKIEGIDYAVDAGELIYIENPTVNQLEMTGQSEGRVVLVTIK